MPMTIAEIESACDASQPLDFSRHMLDVPEPSLRQMFYPLGFATEIRTNSVEVLFQAEEIWRVFQKQFDTEPILVDIHVVESASMECPPAPEVRIIQPLLVTVADAANYSICDLSRNATQMVVSRATLCHKTYLRYFFLESTAGCHIATRYATPVHAGCVTLDGRGVLLCGDSGAGKSTLSYACARSGWGYVSDDASFLLNCGSQRTVIGNCHYLRFRPSAAELFPELAGLEVTPRAAGKPSIELPTEPSARSCACLLHILITSSSSTGESQNRSSWRLIVETWPGSLSPGALRIGGVARHTVRKHRALAHGGNFRASLRRSRLGDRAPRQAGAEGH